MSTLGGRSGGYRPNLAGGILGTASLGGLPQAGGPRVAVEAKVRGIPGGPECLPRDAPELTPQEARAILRKAFEDIRKVYMEAGADKVRITKLQVEDWVRDKPRHYAACRTDGNLIILAPDLARLPSPTLVGIIGHEFGHATDYLYPGSFLLTRNGLDVRRTGMRSNQGMPRDRYLYWEERDDDAIESTADAIAERILGVRIGYLGPCRLQTVLGSGLPETGAIRPRPKGLR